MTTTDDRPTALRDWVFWESNENDGAREYQLKVSCEPGATWIQVWEVGGAEAQVLQVEASVARELSTLFHRVAGVAEAMNAMVQR